ncbi:Sulfotransferase [Candidatus Magnetoovum chiemensis]|nr:Sulfotransferase [Candidatus Magnetoovum chiemensis]
MIQLEHKPEKVILWGVCDFAAKYIEYLREANIAIDFFVDSYKHGTDFNGYKVISSSEYRNRFNDFRHTPVVITGRSANYEDRFVQIAVHIINYLGIADVQILHPAFVEKYITMDCEGKPAVLGFTGSGNALLIRIIEALIERNHDEKCGYKESVFKKLYAEHYNSIIAFFNDIFYINGAHYVYHGSSHFGKFAYNAIKTDSFIAIHYLKTNHHIINTLPFCHTLPNETIIDRFKSMGRNKLFFSIRNPLDIIVSNAFKIHPTVVFMYQDDDFCRSDSAFRENLGALRLNNLHWFEEMANAVKTYLERIVKHKENNFLIRYENLMDNPVETIGTVSRILNIDIDNSEIEALCSALNRKSLTFNKSHLFRPGKDKWKRYFNKRHISILKRLRYEDLLNEIGYNTDLDDVNNSTINDNNTINYDAAKMKHILSLLDYLAHVEFKRAVHFSYDGILYHVRNREFNLDMLTNNAKFLDAYNRLMSSALVGKLIHSLI